MFDKLNDLPQYLGLNDQVYDVLKKAIIQQTIPAGYKLDMNLLAKRWRISRSPVNDAIQRLMVEGLVSVLPRRGTFVASVNIKDVLELMDVRLMFELRAAELTIGHFGDEYLGQMRARLLEMDNLLKAADIDYLNYSRLDLEFHSLPIFWMNNGRINKMYQAQNFQWYMTRLRKSSVGQEEHWEIFKAYESGSLERVKMALVRHIEAGKTSIADIGKNALS